MEQPEIAELFQVLEGNGLKKEQRQVEEFVNYLDSMEGHFYQVLQELGEVKEQLNRIQDGGVRASATRIVKQAGENVQAMGAQLHTVRKNLIQSAKSALHTFKEKGVGALKSAVSAMKIPSKGELKKHFIRRIFNEAYKNQRKVVSGRADRLHPAFFNLSVSGDQPLRRRTESRA